MTISYQDYDFEVGFGTSDCIQVTRLEFKGLGRSSVSSSGDRVKTMCLLACWLSQIDPENGMALAVDTLSDWGRLEVQGLVQTAVKQEQDEHVDAEAHSL